MAIVRDDLLTKRKNVHSFVLLQVRLSLSILLFRPARVLRAANPLSVLKRTRPCAVVPRMEHGNQQITTRQSHDFVYRFTRSEERRVGKECRFGWSSCE